MGNLIQTYNPLTVYGQYNLKKQAYENKTKFISVLSFILLIVVAIIIMLWATDVPVIEMPNKYKYNIPPPLYGTGPYGYGTYLPPAEILSATLS